MNIKEEQIVAIRKLFGAFESILETAKRYPCTRGDGIISDIVRVYLNSEDTFEAMKSVEGILEKWEEMITYKEEDEE